MAGIVGALGAHGFGKSTCLSLVNRGAARAGVRVRISDQWWSYAAGATYSSVAAYRGAVAKTGASPRVVSFRPTRPGNTDEAHELALDVAELVTEEEGGLLEIDEIDEIVPSRGPLPGPIARATVRGNRTPVCSFAWGTQRPSMLNVSIRSQTDLIFVFRVVERADLKWLEENLGTHGPAVAAAAPELGKLECFAVPRLLEGHDLVRMTLKPEAGDYSGRALG